MSGGERASRSGPIAVADDLGRPIHLDAPPRRIVSLVPSLTEAVFALGAGDAVIGVTGYCTEPAGGVAGLAKVGGTKNPDLAAIVALAPDLVLINSEENRRADFDALAAAGLTLFVTETKSVAQAIDLLARLGAAVGRSEEGRRLAERQRAVVSSAAARARTHRPIRYFAPIWKKPWMTFNADTYVHDVLRVAGGENVSAMRPERYPRVALDEIAAAAPEIVLLPDEPYPFSDRDRAALEPLAATPALRDGRVHLVDGKALGWYGPRTADGVALFADLFASATI